MITAEPTWVHCAKAELLTKSSNESKMFFIGWLVNETKALEKRKAN